MSKFTRMIPKPIREKLYPYKMKLINHRNRPAIAPTPDCKMDCADPMIQDMKAFHEKYGANYLKSRLSLGWREPGHMFDELGLIFEKNRDIYLVGEASDVARLSQKLEFLGVRICSDTIPSQRLLDSPREMERLSKHSFPGFTLIVAYQEPGIAEAVVSRLHDLGRHFLNVNMFYESDFIGNGPCIGDYCGIFSVYTAGKVYLKHQNMLVTTICNLNCEYCLNYNPYNKCQTHFSLEELKRSADIYFSHIDRVGFFELTGGEPMLYPHLQELLMYILDNYDSKINELAFVTNGSVVPSDKMCEFLKEHKVMILVDDYSESVPQILNNLSMTIDKLQKFDANVIVVSKIREFIRQFPPSRKYAEMSIKDTQEKFRNCFNGMQNLRDGKLCSCTYMAFAVNAELMPNNPDDWFNMNEMPDNELGKKLLVEFRTGFNKKGYTDWCKHCNGMQTINTFYAPVAEQAKGRLSWDIDNPTYLEDKK